MVGLRSIILRDVSDEEVAAELNAQSALQSIRPSKNGEARINLLRLEQDLRNGYTAENQEPYLPKEFDSRKDPNWKHNRATSMTAYATSSKTAIKLYTCGGPLLIGVETARNLANNILLAVAECDLHTKI